MDYDPNTWRPLSRTETLHHANGETQRKTYAILSDHLGTPKELLDPEGEIAWAADSDLWGDTTVLAEAKTDCPLRFQGQYFDEESRLAYNCQRYYDPTTGRYLSNEPLGLAGGPSPHAYVHNPLGWVDPSGLCPATGNAAKEAVINTQKQAGHIPGTPQNINRIKQGKPTSSFHGEQSGEMATRIAHERGTPVPGRQPPATSGMGTACPARWGEDAHHKRLSKPLPENDPCCFSALNGRRR